MPVLLLTKANNPSTVRRQAFLPVWAAPGAKTADMVADILLNGADPATTPVETFDNGTATVNTETCEGLGLDFETVKAAMEPLCTQVNEIVTAENFDELEAN